MTDLLDDDKCYGGEREIKKANADQTCSVESQYSR
jgi:hypothetical protein